MTTPRCLFCDFGNVIAFFDHGKAARQIARLADPPLDAADVFKWVFQTTLEEEYDSGRISTPQFIERLRGGLHLAATDAEIARAWNDMYEPNHAVADLLLELKRRGVRLVLASNTNQLHYEWFRPLFMRTLDLFDAEVLSFRVGCRKPDLRFFQACLDARLDVALENCVYVDDRADLIDAAGTLGIRGIVYSPGIEPTISDFLFRAS
jgi:putative hydrolase of the HAD superfamily